MTEQNLNLKEEIQELKAKGSDLESFNAIAAEVNTHRRKDDSHIIAIACRARESMKPSLPSYAMTWSSVSLSKQSEQSAIKGVVSNTLIDRNEELERRAADAEAKAKEAIDNVARVLEKYQDLQVLNDTLENELIMARKSSALTSPTGSPVGTMAFDLQGLVRRLSSQLHIQRLNGRNIASISMMSWHLVPKPIQDRLGAGLEVFSTFSVSNRPSAYRQRSMPYRLHPVVPSVLSERCASSYGSHSNPLAKFQPPGASSLGWT